MTLPWEQVGVEASQQSIVLQVGSVDRSRSTPNLVHSCRLATIPAAFLYATSIVKGLIMAQVFEVWCALVSGKRSTSTLRTEHIFRSYKAEFSMTNHRHLIIKCVRTLRR